MKLNNMIEFNKTSEREDRLMVRKSKSIHYRTAPQVKAEMPIEHGVNISFSFTQRRLSGWSKGLQSPERSLDYSLHKHTKIGQPNSGLKVSSS